jgi:hypothetical protein
MDREYWRRGSQRLSATIPAAVLQQLEARALEEGRSLSNLVAVLLERALERRP